MPHLENDDSLRFAREAARCRVQEAMLNSRQQPSRVKGARFGSQSYRTEWKRLVR